MATVKRRELRDIENFLTEWPEIGGGWIHLFPAESSGVDRLIDDAVVLASTGRTKLEINLRTMPLKTRLDFRRLIADLFDQYPPLLEYLESIPPKLRTFYLQALKYDSQTRLFDEKDPWETNLFYEMIRHLAVRTRLLIVLRDLSETYSNVLEALIGVLEISNDLPLLVLTAGPTESFVRQYEHKILVAPAKLSVKEAQHIVAKQLHTGKINSQLITNALYVKSGGQEILLRFMIEAYGRQIVTENKAEIVNHERLNTLRPSERIEVVYAGVLETLDKDVQRIFAFLCRLEDPLPKMYLQILLRHFAISRKSVNQWIDAGLVNQIETLDQIFFTVAWVPWRDFLRKHTSIEQLGALLDVFRGRLNWADLRSPLTFSHLFAETGDISTAITFAFKEHQILRSNGCCYRALDRLAFIRRNLSGYNEGTLEEVEILQASAFVQQEAGLGENAFESYRDLRELQRKEKSPNWLVSSLEMARTLFQMDALSESRYLLKDLAVREDIPDALSAEIAILSGELEENSGHPDYAIRQYESALALVTETSTPEIVHRLYGRLKSLYAASGKTVEIYRLIDAICNNLAKESPLVFYLQLELASLYVAEGRQKEALSTLVKTSRSKTAWWPPRLMFQYHLQTADLYAFFGKWYLSRYHLKRLFSTPLLLISENHKAQLLLNLAIVQKEIGAYRRALDLLESLENLQFSDKAEHYFYLSQMHRGHLYLLVHNPLRSRECLLKCLLWAEKVRNNEIAFQSLLFLSSYEVHHGRANKAEDYLQKAEAMLVILPEQIDHLNAGFYRLQLQISQGKYLKARKKAESWIVQCEGIIKMEMVAFWLVGRLQIQLKDFQNARKNLTAAYERSRRYRMTYFEFQVLKSVAELEKACGASDQILRDAVDKAIQVFRKFLLIVGDEILQKQIEESREFESLSSLMPK